jgi:signal transduction histidine kinase/CheY-like chemotaxis protein
MAWPPPPDPRLFDRRLKRWVGLLAAGGLLLLAVLRAADLWRDREHDLRTAERRAANLSLILAEHLRGAFLTADTSLRHLALHARRVGVAAPPSAWEEVLRSAQRALTGVGSLTIVDATGIVRHSTVPIVGQSRRDDYVFRELAGDAGDRLAASRPFTPLTRPGYVMIPLARPVTTSEGRFDGIVVATFVPKELRGFFENVDVGRDGMVWVFHPDGVVLFRAPSEANPIGETAKGNPIFEASRRGRDDGTLRVPLRPGGPVLVSAFHSLREPPLTVAVSISQREILLGWSHELAVSLAVGVVLALATAGALALFFRQIDARAAAERALLRSQRLEAIGQLTGGVAHDFNNLLTVILGNVARLTRPGAAASASTAKRLAEIEHAAQRAAELTRQLLGFARRRALEPQVVDLNDLAHGLEPMLGRLLGEDVSLRLNLFPSPCLAKVDPAQAEAALMNLCVNARDAMPSGGLLAIETGPVTLDEAYARRNPDVAPGEYVMVSVTDTGTGIAPEHLARVFEPFFTTKEPGKGTGLGLATVYGFVKQSGGHAQVYSELGHGTSVKLYFPKVDRLEATTTAKPSAAAPRGEGQTILLVEDEPALRALATEMLEDLGYGVVAAADGPAALAQARGLSRIDLLLTDVMLPGGMTGRQIAEELVRQRPGLPVLYTSGYSEDVILHRGQLESGLRLLHKPYTMDDLARAVRAAVAATAEGA